jgi:hypothetical protein
MGAQAGGSKLFVMFPWDVSVDHEKFLAAFLTDAGQEPDGMGLAHTALEVDDRDEQIACWA